MAKRTPRPWETREYLTGHRGQVAAHKRQFTLRQLDSDPHYPVDPRPLQDRPVLQPLPRVGPESFAALLCVMLV